MATALITHDACFDHVTPPGHPEQVARLDAVLGALKDMDLRRVKAPMGAEEEFDVSRPATLSRPSITQSRSSRR